MFAPRTARRVFAAVVVAVAVGPTRASPLAAMPPSGPVATLLKGGWSLDPVADGKGRSDSYCFDPAGYLSGASMAHGLGGDFCVRWRPDGSKSVLVYFSGSTPDACELSAGSHGRTFDLSGCREAGHFRRDAQFDLTSWPCDATNVD